MRSIAVANIFFIVFFVTAAVEVTISGAKITPTQKSGSLNETLKTNKKQKKKKKRYGTSEEVQRCVEKASHPAPRITKQHSKHSRESAGNRTPFVCVCRTRERWVAWT